MRGLLEQFGPALEEMRSLLALLGSIDSLEYYEPPQVLPNGDILIRRRAGSPPWPPAPPGGRPEGRPPEGAPPPDPGRPWVDL